MSRYVATITVRVAFSADNGHSAGEIADSIASDAIADLTRRLLDGESVELHTVAVERA